MRKQALIITIIGFFLLIQPISAQTWEATKRLTWNSGISGPPALAIDSNNHIHMVFNDSTIGNKEIYYKKSTNGGSTWTTKRLTYNSHDSRHPDIAVDSNNYIYVAWDDRTPGNMEIYFKKSTDGGVSWTTKRLTYNSGDSFDPAIAVDSNNHIHLAWHDRTPGDREIYYKKSTDGGTSWTTKRLTYNTGGTYYPAITVDSNNHIHMVFHDDTTGNDEIYYKRSTDGGATWTTKRLTYNSGDSYSPAITVDSNNHIQMVFYDNTPGNPEIHYKKSTDGGATWTTKRLTWTSGDSYFPAITVDSNNNIHAVYYDRTPGNDEIYYKRSKNGGSTWSTKRLTYNSDYSWDPAIAIDSNNHIHLAWYDYTPGNWEIYYKKGIQ